ncbi:MAG: helix-turn-helix transcriptional regulator [Oscillospiraceae bacterium]|nr:helix-turn-helix transcriptional regulator [Oscillospiraceae bacterium]
MQHYTRIRDLREDKDLTQTQLCEKLYMHKTTYTNYEQGKHTVPLDFAVILAEFYNVSIDYIAGLTKFPKGTQSPVLSDDENKLIEIFSKLTERNKGRVEQFIDQLYTQQKEDEYILKESE